MGQYWILDPAGHREEWTAGLPKDGDLVDSFMGEAVAIVPPPPDDPDDWICDFCSETILTRWGDEPFPVPSDGSYALCSRHLDEARGGSIWPANMCACDACVVQAKEWHPQLWKAYRQLREAVISQN